MTTDVQDIPVDDAETLALLNSDSAGDVSFLCERGTRTVVHSLGVSCFNELVAAVAMAQPGTQHFLPLYLEHRDGKHIDPLIHSIVDSIASDTHGVPIFREQIVLAIREMSGFDPDRADRMRRHASRILTPEIESEMEAFRIESQRRHPELPRNTIQRILGDLMRYAPYTYPKRLAVDTANAVYRIAFEWAHG